jgi:Spy/CpxP family protein refolding chaperone
MKKCLYSMFAIATLGTSLLFAQDSGAPGTPPAPPNPAQMAAHHISRLSTLLNLNASQHAQASTIFKDQHAGMSGIFSSMRAARTALQAAIENNDVSAISAQAAQIGSLTTQEVENRAKAEAAFYAILTPDQQAKYKQLQSMHGGLEGFGGRGPGHPGLR